MLTFNDLLKCGQNEKQKGEFCARAISEFMGSSDYQQAKAGEAYYNKHNLTIEQFQKMLYTVTGREVPDYFGANYKIKSLFFRRLVTQQVQYVLGNGLTLQDKNNKEKLGKDFDFKLQTAAKRAMAGGRAFGFWNLDHLEVFGYADTPYEAGFCPLYSEETGELMAGVRYWYKTVGRKRILFCTLYEVDGYTNYRKEDGEEIVLSEAKRPYKTKMLYSKAAGVESVSYENYNKLPIVPLYANDTKESELVGIRESIDAYDLIKSGLANDIDDANGFYWIVKNAGGMDDADLAQFVQRMKTVKAATVDSEDDVHAETLDIPTDARRTMLEILRADIYEDFQALDVKTLSAAAKTTQEIQASYQAQDNKCADFEYYILDFVQKILELAEIDDAPSFVWNRVINQEEQTRTILSAANLLTEEIAIKKLPFLTPEEADEIIKQRTLSEYEQFNSKEESEE